MTEVSGMILAGGLSQRMQGKNKAFIPLNNQYLISHVIAQFSPQVDELFLNANHNLEQYQDLGFPIISDHFPDYPGPMAGIHAGLLSIQYDYLAIAPCDCPQLPAQLVPRMIRAVEKSTSQLAVAYDGNKIQPAFSLIHKKYSDDLAQSIRKHQYKLSSWFIKNQAILVNFSKQSDCFYNINSPSDLEHWKKLIK